jgi:arylsulfatase A-like enzyme
LNPAPIDDAREDGAVTPETSRTGAYWTATFVCLAGLHATLALLSPRSIWHDVSLPLWLRGGVLATEVIYLALAVALLAVLNGVVFRSGRLLAPCPACRRLLFFFVALALLIVYLASWGVFEIVGVFADPDAARMFLHDPLQMLQHATHLSASLVLKLLVLGLLLAGGLSVLLPWLVNRSSGRLHAILLVSATLLVSSAAISVLLAGQRVGNETNVRIERHTGAEFTLAELYRQARRTSAGPLSTLSSAMLMPRPDVSAALHVPMEWQPQISMQAWLDSFDHDRLDRKNVIVILVESLRGDQLMAYGGREGVMPAVNALAEDSRVFTNAYAQSSHSNYADLGPLSSQYPLRSGEMYLYPENAGYPHLMLHDLLHESGYRTAIFSSQNEHWGGMLNFLETDGLDHLLHAGNYSGKLKQQRTEGGLSRLMIGDRPSGKIDDRVTVNEALRWIDADREQPFFIYMNLQTSHLPYDVPADFPRRFVTDPKRMPVYLGPAHLQVESLQHLKDLYADSLYYIDAQLVRLFDHLRAGDRLDNTIIVVSADTGTAFQEHGVNGNGADLYNEVVKVPLVIYAPGLEPGASDELVQHIDIPPAILELLGMPAHPAFQGVSVFSRQRPASSPVFLVAQTPLTRQYALVKDDWKLIVDVNRQRHFLYDLADDPGERHDVLADNPQLGNELLQELQAWIGLQLTYYEDASLYGRYYPPVMK